jgi:hypothetical protein
LTKHAKPVNCSSQLMSPEGRNAPPLGASWLNERDDMRESQNIGRLRLRHLREEVEAVGEVMQVEAGRFQRLADREATPVVSSFNLFQTPEPLAARLASMLPLVGRVLEPSAGLGRLYRAARNVSAADIVLVELSHECCGVLYREISGDDNAKLIQSDFLSATVERLGGLFDAIIMNPPFKMGTDVKHILHARTLLAEGGRLVSLCAAGPKQRKALEPIADEWHDLPAGAFKSEGTNVSAAIVVLSR